jgi:16S rRNA G966 N2-methylase RsmD
MTNKAGPPQIVLQANWIHNNDVERWLRRMAKGRTLNVCCGMSKVGDVRVDTDPKTNRTEAGDLFNLHFEPLSFDTVICDPPFRYYWKFDWINELALLARRRFLLSPNRSIVRLPRENWQTRLYAFQSQQNAMYLRLYYCFDRLNEQL